MSRLDVDALLDPRAYLGLAPRLAAALVGYGIVLCLATLPAWAWLLARIA